MNAKKKLINSVILDREAHLDVFEISSEPRFVIVMFGGSGIDQAEYARRSKSVVTCFDSIFAASPIRSIPTTLIYITAPYDVPFARFGEFPEALQAWTAHVWTELLSHWHNAPIFLSSFSGGAPLAFNGVHDRQGCFGGAAIAWDGLAGTFRCPDHWQSKLQLYAGREDRVCGHRENQLVAQRLIDRGEAELSWYAKTGHSIVQYVRNGCINDLILHAARIR
ncbi:hypothetical protein [Aporhodopirellula aestuarii]|uniref:Esterase n=1 Tax=Aporhodopirellula aestuarii TaxID=2950107 RepID=A0ABT0UBB3_9BACT|nr:hypothetical protein [Aporhodopirellula aestuarii]MCM2374004.1 hypothetical protein [Aporhodopirellula aestuarii]